MDSTSSGSLNRSSCQTKDSVHPVKYVADMNSEELEDWIFGLECLGSRSVTCAAIVARECLDGHCFVRMEKHELVELGFDEDISKWLTSICTYSGMNMAPPRRIARESSTHSSSSFVSVHSSFDQAPDVGSEATAQVLYGQLVTLGYKSYRVSDGHVCTPVGTANDKFLLVQRSKGNGLRRCSSSSEIQDNYVVQLRPQDGVSQDVCEQYVPDTGSDMFQFGRCDSGCNDWVARGTVPEGYLCEGGGRPGSVSRYACRIVCDRSNLTVRVYAGGFNEKRILELSDLAPQWRDDDGADGVTTHGVRVWSPSREQWFEVTVKGHMLYTRTSKPDASHPVSANGAISILRPGLKVRGVSNELEDGSILDIGGVFLLFQKSSVSSLARSPVPMHTCLQDNSACDFSRQLTSSSDPDLEIPSAIVESMNRRRPQCPVLLETITFPECLPLRERGLRLWELLKGSQDNAVCSRNLFEVPCADYLVVEENRRPYVFAACGHVHGFSRELQGRPCPLCRTPGPYVPLILPSEPSLCAETPTHVFNPCGHAASEEVCAKWAAIPLPEIAPSSPLHTNDPSRYRPGCPFCLRKLELKGSNGGPYTRIILQCEASDDEEMDCIVSESMMSADHVEGTSTKELSERASILTRRICVDVNIDSNPIANQIHF